MAPACHTAAAMVVGARASWLVTVVAVAAVAAAVPDDGSEEPTAAECLAYLHAHMPDKDKSSLNITDSFLSQNVDLALQARAATPWGKSVPKAIFRPSARQPVRPSYLPLPLPPAPLQAVHSYSRLLLTPIPAGCLLPFSLAVC
eukprot:COSAG02_NODE_1178_length_14042_cov_11.526674_2_plen_144_part_00